MGLRVAAIDFLNPAPLMWDFEHPPRAVVLGRRYQLAYTQPAQCARLLLAGEADLGLIPVAALTPALAVVPGCTIASPGPVRSIQLIVRAPYTLATLRTLAADTASRSSVAYAQVLLGRFYANAPAMLPAAADVAAMLQAADAALVIGDPALLALERRAAIEAVAGPCSWHDVASLWREHTGLPWVAAVWAVRPEAVPTAAERESLIEDLNRSRAHGLAHLDTLTAEWSGRIALPPDGIRRYLSENIHYTLDADCLRAIEHFRALAAEGGILPPLGSLRLLSTGH